MSSRRGFCSTRSRYYQNNNQTDRSLDRDESLTRTPSLGLSARMESGHPEKSRGRGLGNIPKLTRRLLDRTGNKTCSARDRRTDGRTGREKERGEMRMQGNLRGITAQHILSPLILFRILPHPAICLLCILAGNGILPRITPFTVNLSSV